MFSWGSVLGYKEYSDLVNFKHDYFNSNVDGQLPAY